MTDLERLCQRLSMRLGSHLDLGFGLRLRRLESYMRFLKSDNWRWKVGGYRSSTMIEFSGWS